MITLQLYFKNINNKMDIEQINLLKASILDCNNRLKALRGYL